jgi:hypothetical protein
MVMMFWLGVASGGQPAEIIREDRNAFCRDRLCYRSGIYVHDTFGRPRPIKIYNAALKI